MRWSRKVTFWEHKISERKKGKTYTVRWTVDGERQREPLRAKTAADNRKSELMTAYARGERFDIDSGLPESELRQKTAADWYAATLQYTEAHWPHVGSRQRLSIAEGLSEAMLAVLKAGKQRPTDKEIRAALREWAYAARLQGDELPDGHRATIAWLQDNTIDMTAFEDDQTGPALARGVLEALSRKQDGKAASANYANRRRTTVNGFLEYAVEMRLLRSNPLKGVTWRRERSDDTVDPAVVPNSDQINRLLAAVVAHGALGKRLEAFFATMVRAGLRPEEAIALHRENVELPPEVGEDHPEHGKQFGEFRLRRADTHAPTRFNDDRTQRRSRRRLKHRGEKAVRIVPIEPRLVAILRKHINQFGYGPGDRLFVGPQNGVLSPERVSKVWRESRPNALTEDELTRGIAAVPYNLRHACVSGWLAAGIEVAQVAEWAGHSIETLLKIYAKCIDGSSKRAKRRLLEAIAEEETEEKKEETPGGEEDSPG
ncbi:tyrosine-type recombinase/integrase [Glycomyces harbinensis]|uniref:Site-specific recombinase XerD n=1 Tax=Glycomyces harbinensis TaxID=58114 RepID=A0A1G6YV15_9ACTN|nr:tyrosine-type recombinase/integrase [Glycomyces harbinensis]SDD94141.1 Site-specific recombinase XerD [Glycomyces harbinensis]